MKSRREGVLGLTASAIAHAQTALVPTSAALAQPSGPDNLEKLKEFKVSSPDLSIPSVPQTGKKADAIRENLKRIT